MTTTTAIRRPLDGMLVLDLGQIYNGPYCGLLLGFMGARVLKIEGPEGDIVRRRKREVEPYPLVMLNSNKESVVLDLKHPDGKSLFLRLARKADVLVENFAAGVMNRLGLGWEVLRKGNPRLVYGSGTGFGLSGPYRDLPAMDLTIQAMSGIMNATGFPDRAPVKAGPAVCDFLGGVHLCAGILGALHQRAEDSGAEMDAAEEVADGGAGLDRRPIGKARRVHDAAHRLDREIHRRQIAVGPAEPEAGAAAVDQPRILLLQQVPPEAQTVHHADGEVLHHHVGLAHETEEERLTVGLLEVENHRLLVGVQHDQGIGLDLTLAGPDDIALRALDLEHARAHEAEQQATVRALVDLAEIEHQQAVERATHSLTPRFAARATDGVIMVFTPRPAAAWAKASPICSSGKRAVTRRLSP